jgi:hypothetical protein
MEMKKDEQDKHKAEVWLPERKELPRRRWLVYRRISIYPTNTPRNLIQVRGRHNIVPRYQVGTQNNNIEAPFTNGA